MRGLAATGLPPLADVHIDVEPSANGAASGRDSLFVAALMRAPGGPGSLPNPLTVF